jgi:16S rRNA (guanine(1405)-N(7))-methyltransferase
MTAEVVERVRRSARYRDVDAAMLERLAGEELPRSRSVDEAVKRVKRRLHQAVGAFRGATRAGGLAAAWSGDLRDPAFREACADVMRTHASTRERLPHLDRFYAGIWRRSGVPRRLLDLGCGLGPMALPWMGIGDATYLAVDADARPLATVDAALDLVGQPHRVEAVDLVRDRPSDTNADVALLLKLVTTLDRQDPAAAARLMGGLDVRHAAVSFTTRTLGGHDRGMERTYRQRVDRLVADVGRVCDVTEASVPNELVFILALEPRRG